MARPVDPTRTATTRRAMLSQVGSRFRKLRGQVRHLVVVEDAFALRPGALTVNTRFAFLQDDAKIAGFRDWLRGQVVAGLLVVPEGTPGGLPWAAPHLHSAYMRGVVRAYTDTRRGRNKGNAAEFYQGGRAEFLQDSFSGPIATRKLEIIHARAYDALQGVTEDMGREMSRVLANGLAAGHGPEQVAREMSNSITGIERRRARAIARTEIIHAHSEGQLDSFEALGVEELSVQAEWMTARDGKVCPRCAANDRKKFTVKEARGLIPLHPNCRCSWLPAGIGEDDPEIQLVRPKRRRAVRRPG